MLKIKNYKDLSPASHFTASQSPPSTASHSKAYHSPASQTSACHSSASQLQPLTLHILVIPSIESKYSP